MCNFPECTKRIPNLGTITIFEFELHETDPRQVLEGKCGGGFSGSKVIHMTNLSQPF